MLQSYVFHLSLLRTIIYQLGILKEDAEDFERISIIDNHYPKLGYTSEE